MAGRRDRILALSGVIIFFVSSFGLSFLVIYQLWQGGDNKGDTQQAATQQDNQAKPKNSSGGKPMDNFTPIAKIDKLEAIDLQPGTGSEVKPSDTVTVHYTGAVAATGKIFQSSHDMGQPVSFGLNQVIAGWKEGIPGMKMGGKRRLLIPAAQAYGATPPEGSGIPANADLVFDVELQSIGQ